MILFVGLSEIKVVSKLFWYHWYLKFCKMAIVVTKNIKYMTMTKEKNKINKKCMFWNTYRLERSPEIQTFNS